MERERIASRRHAKVTPADKRKTSGTYTGSRRPHHPFPVARKGVPAQMPNAKKPQPKRPTVLTLPALWHGRKAAKPLAAQDFGQKFSCHRYVERGAHFSQQEMLNCDTPSSSAHDQNGPIASHA
jgi:hypothetical protein